MTRSKFDGARVPRGLRRPSAYPFYWPFQAAKHGDRKALEELERQMWTEVGA